jgi:hypothetical protein
MPARNSETDRLVQIGECRLFLLSGSHGPGM